jgi:hypothetical protein
MIYLVHYEVRLLFRVFSKMAAPMAAILEYLWPSLRSRGVLGIRYNHLACLGSLAQYANSH